MQPKSKLMKQRKFKIGAAVTTCYFSCQFSYLKKLVPIEHAVLLTDQHVYKAHASSFKGWNRIVLKAGELYKIQPTVDAIIEQLTKLKADRQTWLIGVGGGVITDLAGYIGAIYMRGVKVGFVPTTLLAMVDAALGGKNGIDHGTNKNLVGTIRQPAFLLYDTKFLKTLPEKEWKNGFAEIIKHAVCFKPNLFRALEKNNLSYYQKNKRAIEILIEKNASIKLSTVQQDETEQGIRSILNFGHTLGHAIEMVYEVSHGEAISLGMVAAATLSSKLNGFMDATRLQLLLAQYGLPTVASYDLTKLKRVMEMDKKKTGKKVRYILLEKIGKARPQLLPFSTLEKLLKPKP
jgi:3-dehydroquinate synthase